MDKIRLDFNYFSFESYVTVMLLSRICPKHTIL